MDVRVAVLVLRTVAVDAKDVLEVARGLVIQLVKMDAAQVVRGPVLLFLQRIKKRVMLNKKHYP